MQVKANEKFVVIWDSIAALAFGFICQTALFILSLKPFFHSYVRETADYTLHFNIGGKILNFNHVVLWSYAVPVAFLVLGLVLAYRRPFKILRSRRALVVVIIFGVLAQTVFWFVQMWLVFAAHFTTGDVFNPSA